MKLHAITAVAAATLLAIPAFAQANQQSYPNNGGQPYNQGPGSQGPDGQGGDPSHHDRRFPIDQLVTSTVHQAWLLSGKDERQFFEMVHQLAELSAHNRGVTLPNDEGAGRHMGEFIKQAAEQDTDQLLYVVVDRAVMMSTHSGPHPAGTPYGNNPR